MVVNYHMTRIQKKDIHYSSTKNKHVNRNQKSFRKKGYLKQPGGASCNQRR